MGIIFFLTFCRIVIGSVFVVSFLGKIRNVAAFQITIANFRLLPKNLTKGAVVLFLLSEFIVIACMVIGYKLLSIGFLLATFLLVVFSIALVTVLVRKIQTPCNCFGTSLKVISYYDVARNAGFVAFSFGGWAVFSVSDITWIALTLPELALASFAAVAFVMIWTRLSEIVEIFHLI